MADPLLLYGYPASQPARAVLWVCIARNVPFVLRLPDPAQPATLAALNPRRQVPTLVDGDFVLYEMGAILVYLAEKFGWADLYPADLRRRATLHQYLHFHHQTTRLATFKLMGPHVTIAMGGPPEASLDVVMKETIRSVIDTGDMAATGRPIVARVAELLEQSFFRVDGKPSAYLCSDTGPTLADFACYEELAQLEWAGLFSFADHAALAAWLVRMSQYPGHDLVHRYNRELGDILAEPLTLERFTAANLAGLAALGQAGIPIEGA